MKERPSVWMWPQLSGCTEGLTFPTKREVQRAIRQLSSCKEHRGVHHFAVTNRGRTVSMSPTGLECLQKAGLL